MKKIRTLLLIAVSFCIASCNNDDGKDAVAISPYAGYYTITEAQSDVPVDLDDNGTAHTDLMAEIEDFHHMPGDIFLEERTNGYKSMNFHIPHPNIPDDMSITVAYAHAAWGVRFEYSYSTNEITFIGDTNSDYYREFGVVQSIEILNDTTLKCVLKKDYYDYQLNDMRNIQLTLTFQKID
jgi:hypothetical protein